MQMVWTELCLKPAMPAINWFLTQIGYTGWVIPGFGIRPKAVFYTKTINDRSPAIEVQRFCLIGITYRHNITNCAAWAQAVSQSVIILFIGKCIAPLWVRLIQANRVFLRVSSARWWRQNQQRQIRLTAHSALQKAFVRRSLENC